MEKDNKGSKVEYTYTSLPCEVYEMEKDNIKVKKKVKEKEYFQFSEESGRDLPSTNTQLYSTITGQEAPGILGSINLEKDLFIGEENKKVRTYTNIEAAPKFLKLIEELCTGHHNTVETKNGYKDKILFSGACYTCGALISNKVQLQRCAGCQLVAYCNRNCQKADWKQHKNLCKKFPLENGKNILVRKTVDWRKPPGLYFSDLYKKVHTLTGELSVGGYLGVFRSPRVCNSCYEARPEMLSDCQCCCVSYCSKDHKILDDLHMTRDCQPLYELAMVNWYFMKHHHLQIPDGLLDKANLSEGLKFEKVSKLSKYLSEKWLKTIVNLVDERLAIPFTIHHALKDLKIGEEGKNISEINSFTIHIIQSEPMLDPRIWECFLHKLPNLKTLNITFINGELYNRFNSLLPLERCSECKSKDRVITYNIQPMHYHEYFASDNYVEPDVVAFFGIDNEVMLMDVKDDTHNLEAHHFASQRNMTYSKHTIVILTGHLEFKLEECIKSFQEARPIKVVMPLQKNPLCGFSTYRFSWPNYSFNEHSHFTCIQGDD